MGGSQFFQRLSSKIRNRKSLLDGTVTTTTPVAETPKSELEAMATITVPDTQKILLLYGPRQPYQVVEDYAVPKLHSSSEILVKTRTIGLNPIDWKAP